MARKLCPDEHEDAVQDAFISLWRAAPRFDPSVAPEAVFVMTVVRHRLVDRRRVAQRRGPPIALSDDTPAMGASPEVLADLRRCRAAVEGLDEAPRTALLMSCEGLTHEEIAAATKLPLGTVKSQLRRGIASVRRALFGDEP